MNLTHKLKTGIIAGVATLSACVTPNPTLERFVDLPQAQYFQQTCLEYSLDTTHYRLSPLLQAINKNTPGEELPLAPLHKAKCEIVSIPDSHLYGSLPVRIEALVCPDVEYPHDEFGKPFYIPKVIHIEGPQFRFAFEGSSFRNTFAYCIKEGSHFGSRSVQTDTQNPDTRFVLGKARAVLDALYKSIEL